MQCLRIIVMDTDTIDLTSKYNKPYNAIHVYYYISPRNKALIDDDNNYQSIVHGFSPPNLDAFKCYYHKIYTHITHDVLLNQEDVMTELERLFCLLNESQDEHPLSSADHQANIRRLECHTSMSVGDVCCVEQAHEVCWYYLALDGFQSIDLSPSTIL